MIQDFLEKQTASWLEEDVPIMQENFPRNQGEITNSLSAAIANLCHTASEQQQAGYKGKAAFLCISFLRTNILEDSFQYRLDIYDERFYLDRMECTGCFELDYVWDYFQNRMAELTKAIRSSVFANRIRTRQLNAVKLAMAELYNEVAIICTNLVLAEALKSPEYAALRKVPNFKIVMGEYRDKNMLLFEEAAEPNEL